MEFYLFLWQLVTAVDYAHIASVQYAHIYMRLPRRKIVVVPTAQYVFFLVGCLYLYSISKRIGHCNEWDAVTVIFSYHYILCANTILDSGRCAKHIFPHSLSIHARRTHSTHPYLYSHSLSYVYSMYKAVYIFSLC